MEMVDDRFPGLESGAGICACDHLRSSEWNLQFTECSSPVGALLGMGLVVLEAGRNHQDTNKYLDLIDHFTGCFSYWLQAVLCDLFLGIVSGQSYGDL